MEKGTSVSGVNKRTFEMQFSNKNILICYVVLLAAKLFFLATFSSDYQDKLFIPFVKHFLTFFDNPYQYVYGHSLKVEFPYPPVMLYILSVFYVPYYLFFSGPVLENMFFKLPILCSDLTICYLLFRMFPEKKKSILVFYFASPIILYASYLHSQLDLIPAALTFISVYYLLKNRILVSAIVFGLGISTKFHVLSALPLILIYLLKNRPRRDFAYFILIPPAIFLFFVMPYFGPGYYSMVMTHPKQMLLFDVVFPMKNLQLYLPIFAVFLLYARFFAYPKINHDLFYCFMALIYSVFVLLVPPAPAWYLWMFPFVTIFFIKYKESVPFITYGYYLLNVFYLIYFIIFFIPDFQDLSFLRHPITLKIHDDRLRNIFFTLLSTSLMGIIFLFYRFGVKSNAIYKKRFSTVVGIGGDSGAGKSTLLTDIQDLLNEKVVYIEGDGDHKWERGDSQWQTMTHLNPKANYLHSQADSLSSLKNGKPAYRRDYDHDTGEFSDLKKVMPEPFIAICGLHPFYLPRMRKIIDIKIYVDTEDTLRNHWKIVRDISERGHSREKVVAQIENRETDSMKFITPQKKFADIVLRYYAEEPFPVGDPEASVRLGLKVTLISNLRMEPLIENLQRHGFSPSWDYADDLHTQYLAFDDCGIGKGTVESIAREIIPNLEEILGGRPSWAEGYRGIVQLLVLVAISETMKGEVDVL